jgi:hypothetical protein
MNKGKNSLPKEEEKIKLITTYLMIVIALILSFECEEESLRFKMCAYTIS